MDIDQLQQNWDALAQTDPLWAIVSFGSKKGGRWEPEHFFELGRKEIRKVLRAVNKLPFEIKFDVDFRRVLRRRKRDRQTAVPGAALDFGCGVGRLTQALGLVFEECHGVDVSPVMIDLARKFNRRGDRCRYHVNVADNLRIFPDGKFSLIYSNIVLQHLKPELSRLYLREFVRVLSPGGVLVFQMPSAPVVRSGVRGPVLCTPLPEPAFRAEISAPARAAATPGGEFLIPVTITNMSGEVWPARGLSSDSFQIHLGNHWRHTAGEYLVYDDARLSLPHDLKPGERVVIPFWLTAPVSPGEYVLELDLVQEQVSWFSERGSAIAAVAVQVDGPGASCRPRIDMYGMRPEEVLEIMAEAGATVLHVVKDTWARGWEGFRYYVTRREVKTGIGAEQGALARRVPERA